MYWTEAVFRVRVSALSEPSVVFPRTLTEFATESPPLPVIATPPASKDAPPPLKVEVAFMFKASAELSPRFKDDPRAEKFWVTARFWVMPRFVPIWRLD